MPDDTNSSPGLDTLRPFTTAQALAAGITPQSLRGPSYRRLHKGVHVSARRPPSPLLMAEAALLLQPPTAYASHFTAARVLDLPVPNHPEEHVTVLRADERRRRSGVTCHVAFPGATIVEWRGIRVSSPHQVFVELASVLSLVDLVVLGDAIVRREWTTPEELVEVCRTSKSRHARTALKAARYVRRGVDSPMETRLRMLIVLAGLPEPEVDFKIRNEYGEILRRFDLSYPQVKVLVEYDGRQHAEDTDQYDWDIYRREHLDKIKWRIVVVTAKGVYQKPEETLRRVRDTLEECGYRGLPRRFSDAWRPHFPGYGPAQRSS